MDRLHDLPPRSASLPSPGASYPVPPIGLFQPFPRRLSRRGSEMMMSDGPITPPESPGPEDQQPLDAPMEDDPIVYPPTPVSEVTEDTSSAMGEEEEQPSGGVEEVAAPSLARSLSDENMQSYNVSTLRLTDFEVRGTLGEVPFAPVRDAWLVGPKASVAFIGRPLLDVVEVKVTER